jgi:hypothetical protein
VRQVLWELREVYWSLGILLSSISPRCSVRGESCLSGTCLELNRPINFLNVYGPCTGRKEFWQRLHDLGLLAAENLILAGDLNLTTSPFEIWGDSALTDPLANFFQQTFYKNALIDIKPPDLLPTWRNGRQGPANISKRLDRFLVAESLLLPSYNSRAWVKLPFLSDHAPICLQIGEGRGGKGHPFKFNSMWLKDPTFIKLVTSVWTDCTLVIPGDAQGNLFRKLNSLKSHSILWLKDKKLREQAELNSIELELENLLKQKHQMHSSVEIELKIRGLEDARNKLLRDEEERWRIKSRMLWLAGGDKNTSYFHRVACSRRSKKQIWEIEDAFGTLHHSQAEIKSAAYTHFKSFYQAPPAPSLDAQTAIASLFPRMISPEEANLLHAPCTKEELLEVIKSFKREKSPGPDGWSVELFLHFST